jgi:thiamine kinase-like enzyme
MVNRQEHQQEVCRFLQKHFAIHAWIFSLPQGTGMETYFVQGNEQRYFVKVGVSIERYLVMAAIGLAPDILAYGQLESGSPIIVQPWITGRRPSRKDYRERLESIATIVNTMHHHPRLREMFQAPSSNLYKEAGLRALDSLRQRWEQHRAQVPKVAEFVDNSLDELTQQINQFSGGGLVASHNDICNANWLFASDGRIYLIDYESMSMDDPAVDLGALLWWYYPPELRGRFLEISGYPYDREFKFRMRVRMALHCLSITLPREGSFDSFNPDGYEEALVDLRAILDGRENPQGYDV